MFKKTLLTFSILSVAGAAAAADITNPFYLPQENQIGSITSVAAKRNVIKDSEESWKSRQIIATEEVQYGLTDSLALTATFGNTFEKWTMTGDFGKESETVNKNFQWSVGAAYNILTGPARLQIAAEYGQDQFKNFDGEYKYALGEVKLGYQFKRALPYVTGGVEIPVGQKDGLKGYAGDKLIYNTKVGVYQGSCEKWALDTGVRLTYDENTEGRAVNAEVEASYYLTKNIAASIYATYMLDGKAKYDTDIYDKSVGARLRMFF